MTTRTLTDAPRERAPYVEVTIDGETLRARLIEPHLGEEESPEVFDEVLARLDAAPDVRLVVIDAAAVTFMNSMGVGTCLNIRRAAAARRAQTAIVGLTRDLLRVFRLMNADRLFTAVTGDAGPDGVAGQR